MALTEDVRRILPNLGDSDLEKVCEKLYEAGVETSSDLQYIEEKDLQDVLRPIQIRKLLSSWKSTSSSFPLEDIPFPQVTFSTPVSPSLRGSTLSPLSSSEPSTERPSSPSVPSSPLVPSIPTSVALADFKISLDTLPSNIRQFLRNGKRPDVLLRRKFVRIVVDELRKIKLNLDLKECSVVASKLVATYPDSLTDITDEGIKLGSGYGSLLRSIKYRVEHLNRNNSLSRLRKQRTPTPNSSSSTAEKDSYGCVNWQPEDLPEGETEESLEIKRKQLVDIVEKSGFTAAGSSQVMALMTSTYYLQRYHINNSRDLHELLEQWPLLSVPRWIFSHFKVLTSVCPMESFPAALEAKSSMIRKYFEENSTKKRVKKILAENEQDSCNGAETILLLMAHFDEEEAALFKLVDVTISPAELNTVATELPNSPRLILQGRSIATAKKWTLAADGVVIASSSSTNVSAFIRGLAALFCCFYIFNLEYQTEAAVTLEFIQRCFFKINPESGSKCNSKRTKSKKTGKEVQRKRLDMNPKVVDFFNQLARYDVEQSFLT